MVIKKTTQVNARRFAHDFIAYLKKTHKLPVKRGYLFGSYAKGKQRNWSDIDVAVISPKFRGRIDPITYLALRLRDVDAERGIEAVGFHPDDFVPEDPLVYEIMTSGVKLKV